MTPEGCRSAADVDALAEALFHAPDLGAREGVVHVLALADEGEARPRTDHRRGMEQNESGISWCAGFDDGIGQNRG